MLRLNSKKMLMLDNGKPFSMSLTCRDSGGTTMSCSFYPPYLKDSSAPSSFYTNYSKIKFDVIIPNNDGRVLVTQGHSTTNLASGLVSGTYRIEYEPVSSLPIDYFQIVCSLGNNRTITITNIILE